MRLIYKPAYDQTDRCLYYTTQVHKYPSRVLYKKKLRRRLCEPITYLDNCVVHNFTVMYGDKV